MTGQHRDFTEELKHETVRLNRQGGRTVREVAEDLGIALSRFPDGNGSKLRSVRRHHWTIHIRKSCA